MKQEDQYFGYLNRADFESLSKEKQIQELLSKDLFYKSNVVSWSTSDILNKKIRIKLNDDHGEKKLRPNEKITEAFYNFILKRFNSEINSHFLPFFNHFNKEVFGMDLAEQKKIALTYFKEIYEVISINWLDFLYKEKSESGIEQVKNLNLFQELKGVRDAHRSNLASFEALVAYLTGNESYFTSDHFLENDFFIAMIFFEKNLKVLISLNDRYQFEKDHTFGTIGILKETYKQYNSIFISLELFIWTGAKIKSFKEHKSSQIESLYEALLQLDLIGGKKTDFLSYIKKEHDMKMTKIRKYELQENRKHDFRVTKFKEALKEFAIK